MHLTDNMNEMNEKKHVRVEIIVAIVASIGQLPSYIAAGYKHLLAILSTI